MGASRGCAALAAPAQAQTDGTCQAKLVICDQTIERTFGWLGQSRRLSKDYERHCATSEALVLATMVRLMARRLARA